MTFRAGGPDIFCHLRSMSGVLLPLPLMPEAAAALATAAADLSTTCSAFVAMIGTRHCGSGHIPDSSIIT